MPGTQRSAKKAAAPEKYEGFTEAERSAMKDRATELKSQARRGSRTAKEDGEADLLAKIAEMGESDRALAERIHAIITANAPSLTPRTWYGMPAYAKDGKLLCFFRPAEKFKSRYATLGFSDAAQLDDGAMWPTDFALTKLTAAVEARIIALVQQAAA
jgi:uncharacterized protein YdhG (YjbR/CyaY superfamily)